MNREEILSKLLGLLSDATEHDCTNFSEGTSFTEIPNFDSLAQIELMEMIEQEFDILYIEDDRLTELKTIRDIVDIIVELGNTIYALKK